jgi:inorganic pyrophosphatase
MSAKKNKSTRLDEIAPRHSHEDCWNVIIETPRGSRNEFDYDAEHGLFELSGVLPAGAVFPYDFGFVPRTLGPENDPLEVLVLMDEPAFAGCLVAVRLIGVLEAEQTEKDGETLRRDRLIGVADHSHTHRDVRDLSQVNENLLQEIEHFFESYNAGKGQQFKTIGPNGRDRAAGLVNEGMRRRKRQGK